MKRSTWVPAFCSRSCSLQESGQQLIVLAICATHSYTHAEGKRAHTHTVTNQIFSILFRKHIKITFPVSLAKRKSSHSPNPSGSGGH